MTATSALRRRVFRAIASSEANMLVDASAAWCEAFLRAYHNGNWDLSANGEGRVLELAGTSSRVVLDVGAFVGDWAMAAKRACPNAKIHCFEVATPNLARLSERLGADPDVLVNGFGLGADTGEVVVWHNSRAPSVTSLLRSADGAVTKLTGRVVRGDDYLSEHGIERVDFLKVDVEGSDLDVLNGFSDALANGTIRVVQFEYGLWTAMARHMLADFYDILAPNGYVIGRVHPRRVKFKPYEVEEETYRGGNFVAVQDRERALIGRFSGA